MPELPEVETVSRGLRKAIIGLKFSAVEIKKTAVVFPPATKFGRLVSKAECNGVRRRGKNILIDLSNGYTIWIHLKMTGHFNFLPKHEVVEKHDHVVFHFSNSSRTLRFNDFRRFGRVRVYPTVDIMGQRGLMELGPEPLEMMPEEFVDILHSRRRMIKPALLDQALIAGLGNIYADESLFRAKIHPLRLTDTISRKKLLELHGHMQNILREAIRLAGTTVDTFSGLDGRPGRFQEYLQAYGREGEPCVRCKTPIRRQKISSRSAHFCPNCQRFY